MARLVNPKTQQRFVLLPEEQYAQLAAYDLRSMAILGKQLPVSTFSFTVILEGLSDISEDLENRLFEAGCDDTLLCCANGVVYLEFDREAGLT